MNPALSTIKTQALDGDLLAILSLVRHAEKNLPVLREGVIEKAFHRGEDEIQILISFGGAECVFHNVIGARYLESLFAEVCPGVDFANQLEALVGKTAVVEMHGPSSSSLWTIFR